MPWPCASLRRRPLNLSACVHILLAAVHRAHVLQLPLKPSLLMYLSQWWIGVALLVAGAFAETGWIRRGSGLERDGVQQMAQMRMFPGPTKNRAALDQQHVTAAETKLLSAA